MPINKMHEMQRIADTRRKTIGVFFVSSSVVFIRRRTSVQPYAMHQGVLSASLYWRKKRSCCPVESKISIKQRYQVRVRSARVGPRLLVVPKRLHVGGSGMVDPHGVLPEAGQEPVVAGVGGRYVLRLRQTCNRRRQRVRFQQGTMVLSNHFFPANA